MEYESSKAKYRIVKRTYSEGEIKFVIQMKNKLFKTRDEWYDLLLKYDTIEEVSKAVQDLIRWETPREYKDEIIS